MLPDATHGRIVGGTTINQRIESIISSTYQVN